MCRGKKGSYDCVFKKESGRRTCKTEKYVLVRRIGMKWTYGSHFIKFKFKIIKNLKM